MRGYSLAETVFVLGILAVLVGIAVPALAHSRARVNVTAARNAFVAAHSVARQVAAQYGQLSQLHLDPEGDRFWVTVDTATRPGVTTLDTIGPVVWVGSLFGGVEIEGRRRTTCFDPRGLATPRADCDLPNATVVFRRRRAVDTVTVSRLGRLLR